MLIAIMFQLACGALSLCWEGGHKSARLWLPSWHCLVAVAILDSQAGVLVVWLIVG